MTMHNAQLTIKTKAHIATLHDDIEFEEAEAGKELNRIWHTMMNNGQSVNANAV